LVPSQSPRLNCANRSKMFCAPGPLDTQTHTGTQTNRQTDRQTDRQTHRQTDRQTDRTLVPSQSPRLNCANRSKMFCAPGPLDTQTHTGRHTDTQTDRQTDRQTEPWYHHSHHA